jgi:hypothetical protein
MSAAYQAFAAAGWGDTIPFSLGPCPCCPVEVTACSLPTFRWPRRLVFTVTGLGGATSQCSNWTTGTTYDLVFCGTSASSPNTYWVWQSTASLPGGCCTYLTFYVVYNSSSLGAIYGHAFFTNTNCSTAGPDVSCLNPSAQFPIDCASFDPDAFFPVAGSMGERLSASGDTCCPYAFDPTVGFGYSVDVP